MADKNAVVRGLIGGILYDLMVRSNVYQIKVDENTTLADKLQEIVNALNGKVTASQLEEAVGKAMEEAADGAEFETLVVRAIEKYLEENPAASGFAEGAVLYTEQTLTEDQKAQARANIGSVSGAQLEEAKPFFVPVEMGEDGSSVSTEVPLADIVNAYVSNRLVYALVDGTFQIPLVALDEEGALFLLNGGQSIVMVQLNADGTGLYQMMGSGGGGEAETFVVPVTLTGETSGTIDVPFEEIANAVNSGKFVYATIGMMGAQLPLAMFGGSFAVFSLSIAEGSVFVTVLEDGTAEMAAIPAGGGGGSLIVTVTEDGDNLTADVPFEQITGTIASGGTVAAMFGNVIYAPVGGYGGSVVFSAFMTNVVSSLVIFEDGTVTVESNRIALGDDLEDYVDKYNFPIETNELVETALEKEKLRIPDYVRPRAEAVIRDINWNMSGDCIVFPFLTDAHCGYYLDKDNEAVRLAGQYLKIIGDRIPFDFIANGGDMSSGAWDTIKSYTFVQHEDYAELTADGHRGVPSLWVPGNHDDAPYQETQGRLSQTEVFNKIGRRNRLSGAVVPDGCNYCYLDLEDRKFRIICLDTDDKRSWGTVKVGNGEGAPAYLNAHNVGGAQLQWLANEALDFSGKENPAQWSIIVISHVDLNVSGTITDAVSGETHAHSTKNAADILVAYRSGESGSITHNGVTVSYDFSDVQARAEVVCAIHGHEHRISSELRLGIPHIGCPNIMNGRERESYNGQTYTKTPGTADGTSFFILVIDRENGIVRSTCVGAGIDINTRYFKNTESISYTNQLPISTDADGNVYNGKGYKENAYISSGNEATSDGLYASGFIPCGVTDTLYFKNVGMQTGQDKHRVAFYDANKAYINLTKTNNANFGGFSYGDDGNISALTIPAGGSTTAGTAFIRFCCGYIGADSIVTVNEPIA